MPRKGIFVALTRPTSESPEDHAAFNKWYDEHHVPDTLLLPGFVRGRRYKRADAQLLPDKATDPGFDYLVIYEVDDIDRVPDARAMLPRLAEISTEFLSPAIDSSSTRAFIFEEIADIDEATPVPDGVDLDSSDGG